MTTKLLVISLLLASILQAAISGRILDSSGTSIDNARIEFKSLSGLTLHETRSNSTGHFNWNQPHATTYLLHINAEGFSPLDRIVSDGTLDLILEPSSPYTKITVTATRGSAEQASDSPHITTILDRNEILKKPIQTLGNALESAPGILVQQSTTAQVSPFLRGLTGYQVLNLLDGIRFNNSTFRSGPNQYLAYLEPSQAQHIEALLGPTGVQYGSDSLGGTIHVTTQEPRFADSHPFQTHGDFNLGGASSDLSTFGAARISVANEKLYWLFGASGRKHNDLRAGRGLDSRNVFYRFFGMSSTEIGDLIGSRLQDTGFRQYGLESKLAFRLKPNQLLSFSYQRGVQDQVRGYKDLLGGLGRMDSAFTPQVLNWLYARYELLNKGPFDSVSGTFSVNQQSDGSRRQNLLSTDPITSDLSTVNVYGYTGQASTHWGNSLQVSFGGDIYDEHIASSRQVRNPLNNSITYPRPLYPDNSRYGNYGLYNQANLQLTRKLRASGGIRFTAVRFDDQANTLLFRDTTFHTSLRWDLTTVFGLHGIVSRGFRAPNLNDLGALGLNDLGYEIPASEAIPSGALLSTDAGESALSKGQPLRPLAAESLMNYEAGARINTRKLYARIQLFDAELTDPIARRTLLFPATSAPATLAGLSVITLPQTTAQRAQGVVAVATALDPRAVKAFVNDGQSRYYGIEALSRYQLSRQWEFQANYSYIVGRDLNPNRNIRRLPPQSGTVTLRHTPGGRLPWIELSSTATGVQSRLSGGDIDDERIGASRRRIDIANFFGGSRVAPYLDPATGIFRPTGETLLQIQNRVLPGFSDSTRVPLYRSTAGWQSVSIRAGMPIGEAWLASAAIENLLDHNYRVHGSGIDSPGISAYLSLSYRF